MNVLRDSKNLKDDVIQGELGDCYFLSTLYSLAENPQNIKKMVKNGKASDDSFEANIYIHGEPVTIVVDDSFPVANASKIAPCRVIGAARKPNPEVMRAYLNEIGVKPEEAVMVGDRPLTDILGGKFLGCKTILVGSINPKENLPTKFVRALERSTIKR